MINCNQPININSSLRVVYEKSDKETMIYAHRLASNQISTVRDLVRLSIVELLVLTGVPNSHAAELDDLLRQNNLHLGMEFNEVIDLLHIANVDKIAQKAVLRRETDLQSSGNKNSHEQAMEELKSEKLEFNDLELAEWMQLGCATINEELALRDLWKQKIDTVRKITNRKAGNAPATMGFSMHNLKRYILNMRRIPYKSDK